MIALRNITAISVQGTLQRKIWRHSSSDTINAHILPGQTMHYKFWEKLKIETRDSLKYLKMWVYYCFNDVGLNHTTLLLTKINVNLQVALVVMWGHDCKLIFLHLITPNQYRTSMLYCVKNSIGRKQAFCKYAQQNMCWWNLSNCERWSSALTILLLYS